MSGGEEFSRVSSKVSSESWRGVFFFLLPILCCCSEGSENWVSKLCRESTGGNDYSVRRLIDFVVAISTISSLEGVLVLLGTAGFGRN